MAVIELSPATRRAAADAVEGLQQRASRFASAAVPKLANAAEWSGKSVAHYSAAAGDGLAQTLRAAQPKMLAVIAKAPQAAKVIPRRGLIGFAARRPATAIVGGLAVASLGFALGRWLMARRADSTSETANAAGEIVENGKDTLEKAANEATKLARSVKNGADDSGKAAIRKAEELGGNQANI